MVYPGQQEVVGWERRADEGQGGGARWGVKRKQHGAGLGRETGRGSWVASRAWTSTASRVTMWVWMVCCRMVRAWEEGAVIQAEELSY